MSGGNVTVSEHKEHHVDGLAGATVQANENCHRWAVYLDSRGSAQARGLRRRTMWDNAAGWASFVPVSKDAFDGIELLEMPVPRL